jgi:hypothetical protein
MRTDASLHETVAVCDVCRSKLRDIGWFSYSLQPTPSLVLLR